jgi:hypothetical protein
MTDVRYVRWRHDGWHGVLDLEAGVAPGSLVAAAGETAAAGDAARRSRHAWTRALDGGRDRLWLKVYPSPDGHRAWRAWRMSAALTAAGLASPDGILVARRGGAGVLVTRDAGGQPLLAAVATVAGSAKRELLHALGRAVGGLHAAGFVHGDLVPSNVIVRGHELVLLDHDRTRRGGGLVWWGARRNLVQLGRFVVPGLRAADRMRVLCAYADRRGLSRRARRRLARWVAAKTVARRVAIDRIAAPDAARAGYASIMRSGGPYDPAVARRGERG